MSLKRLLAALLSTAFLFGIGIFSLAIPKQDRPSTGRATTAPKSSADTTTQGKNLHKIMMESYKRSHPTKTVSKAASDMEAQTKSLRKIMMESYRRSRPTSAAPMTAKRKANMSPQEGGRQTSP